MEKGEEVIGLKRVLDSLSIASDAVIRNNPYILQFNILLNLNLEALVKYM